MWTMFTDTFKLFVRGKLFREPKAVLRQWLLGCVATLVLVIILATLGVPLWLTVLVAAFVGGLLQPYLFKNLKYN
jgi:hypothetical protein